MIHNWQKILAWFDLDFRQIIRLDVGRQKVLTQIPINVSKSFPHQPISV